MKVPKDMDDPHEIHFNNFPTRFEEGTGVTIRPGALSQGMWWIANLTSSSVKGSPRICKSGNLKRNSSQLKSVVRVVP
jgi:hypothetical protein